jgi:cation diffusion facilitator CzcD-associated flavoprotein CzcO
MGMQAKGPSVLIIGSGFGGIGLAIALKKSGFHDLAILERAGELGGVWRDNTYPGAACDVPSRFYSYSFEAHWPWSKRFAPQREILDYLAHVANKYAIVPHLRFNAQVTSAAFDETRGIWSVFTRDGRRFEADVLVPAVGLFNRIAMPAIEGRDDFAGPSFHSAEWRHDVDLAGKTVAVIGTGASAVQFVPEIAKVAARVKVFQRTAQYVLPKDERLVSEAAGSSRWRAYLDRLKIFLGFEKMVPRRFSAEKTARASQAFRAHLREIVEDPDLRAKVMPVQELGCKRVLQSNDWYPALQRPNVSLVTQSIARIEEEGLRMADGRLEAADVIIYGTGFTPTDFLSGLDLRGRGGAALSNVWGDGAFAHLGMSVPGFPNFFMMYGPNTNAAGSIIYMLEAQARYITGCIRALAARRGSTMEVKAGTLARFQEFVAQRVARTVIASPDCRSYFKTAAGRVPTQWPGYMSEYWWRTRRPDLREFEFTPVARAEPPDAPASKKISEPA